MAIYSKRDISPIQVKPPPQGGTPGNQKKDQDQDQDQDQDSDFDKLDREIERKMSERQDLSKEEVEEKTRSESTYTKKVSKTELKPIDTSSIKPAFSWKELIRQFVTSAAPPQSTYTKPNSRAATQVSIAQQLGTAAIKPGEKPGQDVYKLVMVFDSSGSMQGTIGRALTETAALLKAKQSSIVPTIGISFFSDVPIYYAANLSTDQGWTIDNLSDMSKRVSSSQQKPLKSILTSAMGGTTKFNNELSSQLIVAAQKGYNIIMFSDDDILWPENWPNFSELYKSNSSKIFFIADSADTFKKITTRMGIVPRTFGHM